MRVRHAVVVATVAALVGTGAVAAARTVRSAVSAAPTGTNTTRFLALTGDPAARTGRAAIGKPAPNGAPTAVTATAPRRPDCGQASASTPAGWCLTPGGTQYTVLRFPIGLAVDPASGEAIVSSDSGGPQALDVINPNTDPRAAVTVSPGANLFLGLSVTGDGTIYASGGNADRVFRYHLTGPAAVPQDPTQAALLPHPHAPTRPP